MKNGFYFDDSLYDDLHGIHPRYGYRKNSILPCDDNIIDKFIDDEEVGFNQSREFDFDDRLFNQQFIYNSPNLGYVHLEFGSTKVEEQYNKGTFPKPLFYTNKIVHHTNFEILDVVKITTTSCIEIRKNDVMNASYIEKKNKGLVYVV